MSIQKAMLSKHKVVSVKFPTSFMHTIVSIQLAWTKQSEDLGARYLPSAYRALIIQQGLDVFQDNVVLPALFLFRSSYILKHLENLNIHKIYSP